MNSYRIPVDLTEHIRNINIRHDASGRYPQTGPDYPEEEQVLLEARKPLDQLHAFLGNTDSEIDDESVRVSDYAPSESWTADVEEETTMHLDPPNSS
jgi:hypothetical protein